MNATDPRQIIDRSAMTKAQIAVVAITVLLNAMDGFDILSIAFASPGIAKEWGTSQLALGIVLFACILAAVLRRSASIAAIGICALIVCFITASSFVRGLEPTEIRRLLVQCVC